MATITFYKDLPLDFIPHPVSGDIRPITNEVAIRRSLMNLILTKKGSKPFYPEYGSTVFNFLFEPNSAFTIFNIKESISNTIKRFEPRVTLRNVDIKIEDSDITMNLSYTINNTGSTSTLETTISRST
jgi:phage baseplate assembly protein W